MDEDIRNLIYDAWIRIKPKLIADPEELQRRLSRRSKPLLQRPPRAWCLAIRAADTRINAATAGISPDDATDPHDREHLGTLIEHDVTLFADTLRKLCMPVRLTYPHGEIWDDAARKLGVQPAMLRTARISGVLQTKYVQGLAGRRGHPVPIVYTDQPLDPCSRGFLMPDPFWSWTATFLTTRIPTDFQQTLRRVPLYRELNGKRLSDHQAHPELTAPPKTYIRRLPAPPPDYVWYKWKDGVYVGDEREQRMRPIMDARNQRSREQRRENPPPSRSSGSLFFRGWRWLCPICSRTAATIYLPVPPTGQLCNLEKTFDLPPAAIPFPVLHPGTFACSDCHNIQFHSRAGADSWNELVTILTGGLLFGSEVEKPQSYQPTRRRKPYHPMLNRSSPKREQVLELMVKGMTDAQIAKELNILPTSVRNHVNKVFKQHDVHGYNARADLASKLGVKLPGHAEKLQRAQDRTNEILEFVLKGLQSKAIAAVMKLSVHKVNNEIGKLFRKHGVSGRAALIEKLKQDAQKESEPQISEMTQILEL